MATRGTGWPAAFFSWCFPGLGAGLLRRYGWMYAWIAALFAATLLCTLSVWCVLLHVAVRFAAAFHALRMVRAADRPHASDTFGILAAIGLNLAAMLAIRFTTLEAFRTPSTSMAPTVTIGDHILVDKLTPHLRAIARGEVIVFRQPCEPDRDYVKRVIALAGETVEVRCNVVYVDGKPLENRLVQGEGCTYGDQEDESTLKWSDRQCSEYRETAGAHHYRVYHDPGRPQRDERLARDGSLPSSDSRDFPMVNGERRPPRCPLGPDGLPSGTHDQKPGEIVVTKQNAGACELQMHYVVPADHVFVLGDNRANSNDSRYWGSVPLAEVKGRVIGIWVTMGRSGPPWGRFGGVD